MFLREFFEAVDKVDAAFAFGRFNPAHQGHIEVYKAVQAAGKNWFIGTNPNTQGPNDPLTFEEKSAWMEAIYPEIKGHVLPEQSVVTLASKLYEMLGEGKTIAYVTDSKDWEWAGKLLNDYNGKEGPHGYYKFNAIKHVESPRVSSATALRTAARAGDEAAFYAASGTDPKLTVNGQSYFDTVVAATGANPEKVKKVSKKETPRMVRDRKTGKEYDPTSEFDKLKNSPDFQAQMKRMAMNDSVPEVAGNSKTMSTADFEKGIYSTAARFGGPELDPEAIKNQMVLAPNGEVDIERTFEKIIAVFQTEIPRINQLIKDLDAAVKRAEAQSVSEDDDERDAVIRNNLQWPEIVNKVNSAMKATGWKGRRKDDNSYMFSTKGMLDDEWYIVIIENRGNNIFTYALGTVEEGDPHIGEQESLPMTEASVSELMIAVREGFGLGDSHVSEISKSTLDRYLTKASDDHGHADFAARMSKHDPDKRSYHVDQKRTVEKRRRGISRALDRMSREGVAESSINMMELAKKAKTLLARGMTEQQVISQLVKDGIPSRLAAQAVQMAQMLETVVEGSAHGYNVVKWYKKWNNQLKLTKWLRKEAGLPKDAPVYFDDADLVYGEKTIVPDALINPNLKFNDLLTAVAQAGGGSAKQKVQGVYRKQGASEAGSNAMANIARRLADKDDGKVAKLRAAGDKRREDQLKGRNISRKDRSSKDMWGDLKDSLAELSTELLGKYKKAASDNATAADKRADFKKGDKRFSGIIKATKKQFDNDLKNKKK
jgi:hypothetical protein